jgi:bis(5'-nucleosyl)-tetraphosphatase (symmetrical)
VGDLVNRGPDSLGVLRRVQQLGDAVTTVLGNHDLHLLAAAAGHGRQSPADTFEDVLLASDCEQLITWLRHQPLLHWDQHGHRALVHAGVPPEWTLAQTSEYAREIETILQGPHWRNFFENMYGDDPALWSADLNPKLRQRYTVNALTRMRQLEPDGSLNFSNAGPPDEAEELTPWFRFPGRRNTDTQIVFGHWASLGLIQENNVAAIDSGCVWGRSLSALPLDPPGEVIQLSCEQSAPL